jgi:hypothetical protein
MTRHVVPTAEVFHLWANQSQDHAHNSTRSVWFNYAIAYSYSTPIGRVVTNARGERAYLVTARTYSMTTSSKHMPALFRAIGGARTIFRVFEVGRGGMNDHDSAWTPEQPEREVVRYAERIAELEGKAKRARTNRAWYTQRATELKLEAAAYCQFFDVASEFTPEVIERLTRALEHDRALRIEHERERDARARKERAERYEVAAPLWRSREISQHYALNDGPVMLRLSADGSEVETSHGARVPLVAARLAYRALHTPGLDMAGMQLGSYRVNSVSAETLVVGCHHIPRQEIEQLAGSLGWSATPLNFSPAL